MKNIREKRNETKIRRESLQCKTFELKINSSHLSKNNLKHLNGLFREAKWFYNYCLSQENINDSNTKLKSVPVLNKNKIYENRNFEFLSSQMKQSIKARAFDNLISLNKLKTKGHKVGKLKFKSFIESVPLVQLNSTFYINRENKRVRIQGMKSWMRVNGLSQIPYSYEIANANLVKKANEFYINITTFSEKEVKNISEVPISIDFGCETQLTLDNGIKINFQVLPTENLKRLDRKINRKQSYTNKQRPNSKKKTQEYKKRKKIYNDLTNKKDDIRNKVVNAITNNFKYVIVQDESINAWKASGHGKKIQHTGIGGIIRDLKSKSHTPIVVDRLFPSSQLCSCCGHKQKMKQEVRTYECPECGNVIDRDLNSALNIKAEGMKQIPMERREFKTAEILSSTNVLLNILNNIHGIKVSMVESMKQRSPCL